MLLENNQLMQCKDLRDLSPASVKSNSNKVLSSSSSSADTVSQLTIENAGVKMGGAL